jgi:hypothetical protein
MPKQLLFNEEARAALLRGINTMPLMVLLPLVLPTWAFPR